MAKESKTETDLMGFLLAHTKTPGTFRVTYNEHKLKSESADRYYAQVMGNKVDYQAGIYKLIWHPRGVTGGTVTIISNTTAGLMESAAKLLKIDRTGKHGTRTHNSDAAH
jgi:hypothetical protein